MSRADFAQALKRADPALFGMIDRSQITVQSIRLVKCVAPQEEPTEFRCDWRLQASRGWRSHRNWMTLDAAGWRGMDQELS